MALANTNTLGAYSAAYRLTALTELRVVWQSLAGDRLSPVIRVGIGSYGGMIPVDRASGLDRYATAAEASKSYFGSGSVTNVVIASGASFADALSANGLAGVAASPLLLTAPSVLPAATLSEIDRESQEPTDTTVWIVGGEMAVGPAVADALIAAGYHVNRLAGADRYHTARLVAAQVVAAMGDLYTGDAFLANGRAFADGLSVGPAAYANGLPVLLAETDELPAGTMQAIVDEGVSRVLVVGGTAAVSDAVLAALPAGSERVAAGADRYATAVAFATWARAQGYASYGVVGIASGAVFPDALSAGAPLGAGGGVLLLTPPDVIPGPVNVFLVDNKAQVGRAVIFGGVGAVGDAVRSAIYDCLND
ncbi:cell wall-binding repeat-containing protein [bacterium]|nr:cell wall-binding repeat-containing protein [bacterium]